MDREKWQRAQQLFHAARRLPTQERRAFVIRNASEDPELVEMVVAALECDLPFTQLGPYRILRVIGEGGMAVVYLGVHEEWNSQAAIKIPRDALVSRDRQERFALEQRILAQLRHPNIARIYEAGILPDSTPWFAMEYIEGEPLTTYCNRASLSVRGRIELFRSVCEAVAYAHTEGVIHRDLKPSNILVTPSAEVKLLDFGIAKQIADATPSASVTRTGMQPMTLAYAAPEQVFSQQVGKQTDVYALGVLLYELLAGDLPFQLSGVSPSQLHEALSAEVKKPSAVAREWGIDKHSGVSAGAWADVDVLVLTAMHKDTLKRYESAQALREDVNRFLNDEPLRARSDSAGYRVRKFVERRRVPVTMAVVAMLVLLGVWTYFTVRLTQSRNAAVAEAERATRIQEYLVKVFTAGDSENGPSKEMKVGVLLDNAVEQLHELDKDPRTQGDLYDVFGTIYQQFSDLSRAESLLQRALAERRQTSGAVSPGVAETTLELGLLRSDQAKFKEAERLVREGLAMAKQTLPATDPKIGRYETALGSVLVVKGDFAEASEVLQQAMRMQAGRPDGVTGYGECLSLLATADINLRKFPEAENYTKKAIALDIEIHGPEAKNLSDDYANLAMIQFRESHFADAEASYRHALAIDEKWYSPGNPETADVKRLLGEVLLNDRQIPEAERLAKDALANLEKAYGPDHPRVAYSLMLLAHIDEERGYFASALTEASRAVKILRGKPQADYLAIALSDLGRAYLNNNKPKEAESAYREAAAIFSDQPTSGPAGSATVQLGWGDALVRQKRYPEAEEHLSAAYRFFQREPAQSAKQLALSRADMNTLYLALGQPDKAAQYVTTAK